MKTYTVDEMKAILAEHEKWINGEGGSRAYLSGADLRSAYLSGANLSGANLRSAYLSGAYLSGANLSGANLRSANLRSAYLSGANLSGANLRSAYLSGAYLSGANLSGANLSGAYLSGANLRSANLSGAKTDDRTLWPHFQIPAGDLIVYKKAAGHIVTLAINRDVKRTGSLVGRKCRAASAYVVETDDHMTHESQKDVVYTEGATVFPDSYDDNPMVECSNGIHFFLTRKEAEEWT